MGLLDMFRRAEVKQAPASTKTRLVPGVGRMPYPAYHGEEPYIFVSYAHYDSDAVFREIARLNEAGYHVWYDEGIAPGNEWTDEIADALAECSLFVVMITPRSVESRNVQNEINFAIDEQKPFVAIHLEETTLRRGLKLQIGTLQAILKYKMTDEEYAYKYVSAFTRLGLMPSGHVGAARPVDAAQSPAGSSSVTPSGKSDVGGMRIEAIDEPSAPPQPAQANAPAASTGYIIDEYSCLKKYEGNEVDVTIPSGVKTIGEDAFKLSVIERVVIPDSVEAIRDYAFSKCYYLEEVIMGDNVREIGTRAFGDCAELMNVKLSKRLMSIGGNAFEGCSSLMDIQIPDYVRTIGPCAFYDAGLECVEFGKRVAVIDSDAFCACEHLDHVRLPASVRELHGSFASCRSLADLHLNEGLRRLGYNEFFGCDSLKEVVVPTSVSEIGEKAFEGCPATVVVHAGSYAEAVASERGLNYRVV